VRSSARADRGASIDAGDCRDRASGTAGTAGGAAPARNAQLDELHAQLTQLLAQSADLQAKLKDASDRALDPAGYQQIKTCVQLYAAEEQAIARIINDPNFPANLDKIPEGRTLIFAPGQGRGHAPTTCTDAAKFLK
jgi:hypothetical protein